MTDTIVPFPNKPPCHGVAASHLGTPVPIVITRLRMLLQRAEAGEISGIAFVCTVAPGGLWHGSAGRRGTRQGMLAGLAILTTRLATAILEASGSDNEEST